MEGQSCPVSLKSFGPPHILCIFKIDPKIKPLRKLYPQSKTTEPPPPPGRNSRSVHKYEEKVANFPLSDYAMSVEVHVLKRYSEKIKLVGIDPFLLSEKDFDTECLPPVETIDVVSFLVLETSHYTQDQLKAFTSLQAYDQMVSGFIKTVQGRVINGNFIVYDVKCMK